MQRGKSNRSAGPDVGPQRGGLIDWNTIVGIVAIVATIVCCLYFLGVIFGEPHPCKDVSEGIGGGQCDRYINCTQYHQGGDYDVWVGNPEYNDNAYIEN
jgi:hypothetical protein